MQLCSVHSVRWLTSSLGSAAPLLFSRFNKKNVLLLQWVSDHWPHCFCCCCGWFLVELRHLIRCQFDSFCHPPTSYAFQFQAKLSFAALFPSIRKKKYMRNAQYLHKIADMSKLRYTLYNDVHVSNGNGQVKEINK